MSGEKSLNMLINEHEQNAAKQQAENAEKAQRKIENQNRNTDEVITLDIQGRNRGFREKAGLWRSLVDNAKTTWKGIKENWSKRNEMLRVVPEESTTKARYEATLQRGEQAVEQASAQTEAIVQRGENLAAMQEEIQEIGDVWSNQHEGDYEVAQPSASIEAPAVQIDTTIEAGDEWDSGYEKNHEVEASMDDGDDTPPVEISASSGKKSAGESFAEYAYQKNEKKQLAEIIARVNPLKEGNGALAQALESGQLNQEQKNLVGLAIEKLKAMPNWGKKEKQIFTTISTEFANEKARDNSSPQEGLGDVFEAHAEDLKVKKTFLDLGKLILEHHPLNLDNRALAEGFESGEPTTEQLQNGLKAIVAIQKMVKWPKATIDTLKAAEVEIKKQLAFEKVIAFDQAKAVHEEKKKRNAGEAVEDIAA